MRDPMLDPQNVLASGQELIRGDPGPSVTGGPLPPGVTSIGDTLPAVVEELRQWSARHRSREHDHRPVQHRDGKPPWCRECGLDARGRAQTSLGRLTLVVRACDAALASSELDDGTRRLIEAIRDQARRD